MERRVRREYVARLVARWDDVSDCYALHCGWCCGGVVGLQLKQLLGIRTVALTFRREALSVLDVAFVAAAAFPPKRRCSITGPLLDELLVATFLGPLLTANLRAPPYLTLFATDASLQFYRLFSINGPNITISAKIGANRCA